MVLKRQSSEGEGDGSKFHFQEPKRRYPSSPNDRCGIHGLSAEEFAARLEPFLRVVVRDAVEHAMKEFCCSTSGSSVKRIEPAGVRTLQLHFQNKLPSILFTGSRIESEDNIPIKVVLLDANTGWIVNSGPSSSLKVEIIALDGDFGADDEEHWTETDFNSKIVHEREGKRPLVTGDLVVPLIGGVGELGDICFTDNSSWIRCRKFRLGARVQSTGVGVRIKEAKSEPFVVKDHRGESYKKHHPPSLDDEIWRLERIAKEGAFHKRLVSRGIYSVQDFLQLYATDSSLLRSILGAGVSNKTWEIIIKHASACVLDHKLYTYHCESIGLVFNSIFKVVAVVFDGQNYQSLDKLNSSEMRAVEDFKLQAYKNLDHWVATDEMTVFGTPLLLSSQQAVASSSALDLQNLNIPAPHQGDLQMVRGPDDMATPQTYMYEMVDSGQLDSPMVQNIRSMQVFSPALRNSFIMRDFGYAPYGDGWGAGPSGSPGSILLTGAAGDDEQYETPLMRNGFYGAPNSQAVNIISSGFSIPLPKNLKPKARWCKIRAAIRWVSVRRDVAARKTAQLLPCFDF